MSEQHFVELLQSLLSPDTERIKAATAELNKTYYTSPETIPVLIHIIAQHPETQLRQLAAVEARKLVSKQWSKVQDKDSLRKKLLEACFHEEQLLVRHSACRVVTAVAKVDFENSEWVDLPQTLLQGAESTEARHREVAMYIIFTLVESLGDFFMEALPTLFNVLAKTIKDPQSSEVRINTMLTISRVAMLVDTDEDEKSLEAFQALLPDMVAVLKATIDANEDAEVMQAFEVFQTLLGCDAALLNKHFGDLVKFMLQISVEKSIDDDFRSQALAFLMQCARYRKLKLQSLKLGEEITTKALSIVPELGDLSSDDEDITPARSALGLLDILASSLPPSQVVVPLLKAIGPYVSDTNPDNRRAGILALGMCVEGAPDFIATQLAEILPMVLRLLEDADVRVRAAALQGVARLSDDLAEDVAKEHAKLIPAMIKNFDLAVQSLPTASEDDKEEHLGIVRGTCNAVDSLIEGLEKAEAAQYIEQLVPRFSRFFDADDYKSQIAAITAVGSIASSAGDAFAPYFQGTMQTLGPFIPKKESQEELELRGAVCDTMGKVAQAVGAEAFQQYVNPLMQASEEALHLDHPRLRETSYILWSTLAKIYEEEFSQYLEGVVKGLHDCLEQEEAEAEISLGAEAAAIAGKEIKIGGKTFKVTEAEESDDDEIIEVDDDDDDDFEDITNPATAIAMEKEIAVEVIGDVLTSTKARFVPYLEKTVAIIFSLVDHQYEGIRRSAVGTLFRAYASVWGLAEGQGMEKWQAGIPLKVQPPAEIFKLGAEIMKHTLDLWEEEMDRATVTDIHRSVGATLKVTGPSILMTVDNGKMFVDRISQELLAVFTKKHPCQQDLGEDIGLDEELLEESSEYDWLVIDTAFDCVVGLASALGDSFGELWQVFAKHILKYVSSQEPGERCSAVGCIAEVVEAMGGAVTPYTDKLLTVLLKRLSDEDPDTKANAMYAVGMLCEKSNDVAKIKSAYNSILGKLEPVLDAGSTSSTRVLDNAAGCVSRMIKRHPDAVPLPEVLPRLLEILPVREDYEENAPAFAAIIALYQAGDSTIQSLTPQVKPIIEKVLSPPEDQLDEETKAQVLDLVKYLQNNGA